MERGQFLVETCWLAEHLEDPHLRVVDMRGYVRTVEHDGVQDAVYVGARDEYEQGHIPGALYIDWSSDIVDPHAEVEAQIAPADRFAEVLGNLGIGDQHLVVAYDAHRASQFATRLWWALNCNGDVAATTILFSLAMLGYPKLTNYDGSWNEWGERQDLPTEL